jgi:hypothetical protein
MKQELGFRIWDFGVMRHFQNLKPDKPEAKLESLFS